MKDLNHQFNEEVFEIIEQMQPLMDRLIGCLQRNDLMLYVGDNLQPTHSMPKKDSLHHTLDKSFPKTTHVMYRSEFIDWGDLDDYKYKSYLEHRKNCSKSIKEMEPPDILLQIFPEIGEGKIVPMDKIDPRLAGLSETALENGAPEVKVNGVTILTDIERDPRLPTNSRQ